jgi:hypothetical protein
MNLTAGSVISDQLLSTQLSMPEKGKTQDGEQGSSHDRGTADRATIVRRYSIRLDMVTAAALSRLGLVGGRVA